MRQIRYRLAVLIVIAAGVFASLGGRAIAEPAAYIIADQTTGFVLASSKGEEKRQIASLTKIATAMVALDWATAEGADLSQLATVPPSAAPLAAQHGIGLAPGDRCSLRDLIYAALMQSDNQAAETIAYHVGSKLKPSNDPVATFVAQMNALGRTLGMRRTRFLNAHGLDTLERKLPFSTAGDVVRLTAYAMRDAAFRFHVSQKERKITIHRADGETTGYLLRNTNELLGMNAIDGVKTGQTKRAGGCVVISASRPPETRTEGEQVFITPRRINVVVLGSNDRFGDAARLLQQGWSLYDAWAAAGRPQKDWKPRR